MHRWMRDFHTPLLFLAEQVQLLKKTTIHLMKKTKNEYYCKMVDNATNQNIWSFQKWMVNNRTYTSPPMDHGENVPPAITHEQKCDMLRKHLFLDPPELKEEPELDLSHSPEDLEYVSITKREVKNVIFSAAQLNVPGISGLIGRPRRWAWEVLEDALCNLVRLCTDSGYHPKAWRTSIAVMLQKLNRDYSKP